MAPHSVDSDDGLGLTEKLKSMKINDPPSPIDAYFAQHAKAYTFKPANLIQFEFKRLAAAKQWEPNGTLYKRERRAFAVAVAKEYQFGLEGKSELECLLLQCIELGATTEEREGLTSRTKCRKFLDTKFVNIFDVLNGRRHRKKIRVFESYAALRKYTAKPGKGRMFPREVAKESGAMAGMLFRFFKMDRA